MPSAPRASRGRRAAQPAGRRFPGHRAIDAEVAKLKAAYPFLAAGHVAPADAALRHARRACSAVATVACRAFGRNFGARSLRGRGAASLIDQEWALTRRGRAVAAHQAGLTLTAEEAIARTSIWRKYKAACVSPPQNEAPVVAGGEEPPATPEAGVTRLMPGGG